MEKPEQILILEPRYELKFRGPFTSPVTSYMNLTNPADMRVLFKIKTTAPKKYCVRPNSGLLEAKDTIQIAVCLQPFQFDTNEKNRHKFMVQTMIVPEGDINPDELWKEVQPENLMDSKLKCVFEIPEDEHPIPSDSQNVGEGRIDSKLQNVFETPQYNFSSSPENTLESTSSERMRRIGVGDKYPSMPNMQTEELAKAASQVKNLREEGSSLRQENLRLKQEVMQLRQSTYSMKTSNFVSDPRLYTPVFLTIFTICVGIIGVLVGKYIL